MDGWMDRYVDREIYPLPLHGSCDRQTSKMAPRIATSWYSRPCITHLLWVCLDHHSKLFKIWIQKSNKMLYFQLKIAKLTNHCDFLPSDLFSLSLAFSRAHTSKSRCDIPSTEMPYGEATWQGTEGSLTTDYEELRPQANMGPATA